VAFAHHFVFSRTDTWNVSFHCEQHVRVHYGNPFFSTPSGETTKTHTSGEQWLSPRGGEKKGVDMDEQTKWAAAHYLTEINVLIVITNTVH
jgi:hypothetical protein